MADLKRWAKMKLIAAILLVAVMLGGSACVSKTKSQGIAGRWLLVAGGQNEHVILDLKEDHTYALRHWVDFHDINGADRGSWSLNDGIVSLVPTVRGAEQGEVFVPFHCAKLQIANYGEDLALVSVSVPIVPYTDRQHAIFLKEKPNQSLQPTAPSGRG